jgi:hypothetical protein
MIDPFQPLHMAEPSGHRSIAEGTPLPKGQAETGATAPSRQTPPIAYWQ